MSEEVASNKSYLDGKMDSIKTTASDGITGITIDSASYSSTTKIPTFEPTIENNLLNGIKELFKKISTEADSIKAVGVDFQDMDNFLEGVSTSLGFNIVSKDEPIVELIDYSNMSFEELLNANIPSVPNGYSGYNGYSGDNGGYSSGGDYSSTPDTQTPKKEEEPKLVSLSSEKTTTKKEEPTTTKETKDDYEVPEFSKESKKDSYINVDKTENTKTTDTPVLDSIKTTKSNTKEDKDIIIDTKDNNAPSSGIVKLSSNNNVKNNDNNNSNNNRTYKGGGTNYKGEEYTNTQEDSIISEPIIDDEIIVEEPQIEDLILDDYSENIVNDIEEPIEETEPIQAEEEPKKNNILGTLGIAAGIGVASGAVALASHKMVKSKDEDEEDDYGYESDGDY